MLGDETNFMINIGTCIVASNLLEYLLSET